MQTDRRNPHGRSEPPTCMGLCGKLRGQKSLRKLRVPGGSECQRDSED